MKLHTLSLTFGLKIASMVIALYGALPLHAQTQPAAQTTTVTAAPVSSRDRQDSVSPRQSEYWTREAVRAIPTPQAGRMTDKAILNDYQAYNGLQTAINSKASQLKGASTEFQYALAKAQCYLDASFQEYTRNDRSSFVEESFLEAQKIVEALGTGNDKPWNSIAFLNDANQFPKLIVVAKGNTNPEPIQALMARLKNISSQQRQCAPVQAACAEVATVHAVNEFAQGGLRHAKAPMDLAEQHFSRVESCKPPVVAIVAPTPVTPVAVTPPPAPVIAAKPPADLFVPRSIHFAYDAYDLAASSKAVLDNLAHALKLYPGIRLKAVGHTDQRASDGYNIMLSMRRVAAVQAYLQQAGVPAGQIQISYVGKADPEKKGKTEAAYQYNRRVVFELLTDSDKVKLTLHAEDLQPCGKLTLTRCPRLNHKAEPKEQTLKSVSLLLQEPIQYAKLADFLSDSSTHPKFIHVTEKPEFNSQATVTERSARIKEVS